MIKILWFFWVLMVDYIFRIEALDEYDRQKHKKEKARNQLESYVFDAQNKLDLDEYVVAATDEEKESILKACQEVKS